MIGLVTYSDNQTTATLDDYANICETGYDNTKIGSFAAYANYQGLQAPFSCFIHQEQSSQIQIKRNPDITCYYAGDSLKINRIVVKVTYDTDEYGNDIFFTEEYLDFDKDTVDHLDNRIVNIGYMGYIYIFSNKNF